MRSEERRLNQEVREIRFQVVSLNDSYGDVQTPTHVEVTLGADVYFAFDKADLAPAGLTALADLAPRIGAQSKGPVTIDGYTDSKGAAGYNKDLSQRRAAAVQAELTRLLKGKPVSFTATGHGAADFVAPNTRPDGSDDPDGRARNRRVTITFDR